MKIIMASDHGGFELKKVLQFYLEKKGFKVEDVGCKNTESVDYPVFVKQAVPKILLNKENRGIFICGTGIGMSIMANRTKGIRAALVHSQTYAQLTRGHNDSNVLCLGGRFIDEQEAKAIVDIFLSTPFMGAQHIRRVNMLDGK